MVKSLEVGKFESRQREPIYLDLEREAQEAEEDSEEEEEAEEEAEEAGAEQMDEERAAVAEQMIMEKW